MKVEQLVARRSPLSQPIVVRLTTAGDVVAFGMAMDAFADFAEERGAKQTALALRGLVVAALSQVPDDWDCGDPDCEACGEKRGAKTLRFPAPHLRGDA
jgi:hypothetical protein